MYLTDHYNRTLDAKSRLTLPADFRKQFDDRVCLVPFHGALCGFTPEGHQKWVMSFFPNGFNPMDREQDQTRRKLSALTTTVDIDSAGRIAMSKVSEAIRKKFGLGKDLEIVGNVDHFEIFSAEKWAELQSSYLDEDLDSLLFD
ncbi:MAG: division/cell wall cluster transcriptional repressor MraZ [Tractidigestivibacter sp.]|jgi:MraZ protein|uniref:division/cell wall cluster transcriptional repressor MraZ n=1 Tax=Tractidigestivibacter sp. TaxID=2847320 RepID=UPI003D8F56F8